MLAILQLLETLVANPFRSPRWLEVENLFLRHKLNIAPHRLQLRGSGRALLVWMVPLWPRLLGLSRVVQPETILGWLRAGFGPIGAGASLQRQTSPLRYSCVRPAQRGTINYSGRPRRATGGHDDASRELLRLQKIITPKKQWPVRGDHKCGVCDEKNLVDVR